MPQDEIWVRHCKKPDSTANKKKETLPANLFAQHFRRILDDGTHSDVLFIVGKGKEEIRSHKAILSARSEYFNAMFREGSLAESVNNIATIENYESVTFKRMIEFIYTNSIIELQTMDSNELIDLIMIANEYILDDLKVLCSSTASKLFTLDNIGKFMLLSSTLNLSELRDSCLPFVRSQKSELRQNRDFINEIENAPELGLMLFDALESDGDEDLSRSSGFKRARYSEPTHELIPSSNSLSSSSNMIQGNNSNFGNDIP